jgi:hypothetical protein
MDDNNAGLTREQLNELFEAIQDAFPQRGDLAELVYFKLGQKLENIAGGQTGKEIAFNLVVWLDSNGKIGTFVKGALEKNPDNSRLKSIGVEILAQLPPPQKEPSRGGDQLSEKTFSQRVTNNPVVNISAPERSASRQFENEERLAGTSKTYSDGSLDISNKRGQRTQAAKSSDKTFNISEKAYMSLTKSQVEAKNLKTTVEEQKNRIDQLNTFLQNAKAAISEVNAEVKKYEEVNQRIEPHLISCNLLEEYILLCEEYLFDNKHPTEENLKAMKRQAMKILKDCQKDNFAEWVAGLMFADESKLVEYHQNMCAQVKQCAQSLEARLTPNCDLQLVSTALRDLSSGVTDLLDSWTKAQARLHDEITSRLNSIREELA